MRVQTFGTVSNTVLSIGAGALTQSPEYSYLALPVAIAAAVIWLILLVAFVYRNRDGILPLLKKVRLSHFLLFGLAASIGGNIWLAYLLPHKTIHPPTTEKTPLPVLSEQEKKDHLALTARIITPLNSMKAALGAARDISENWQYKVQSNPSDFFNSITTVSNGLYSATYELNSISTQYESWKDTFTITQADFPDCYGKTIALRSEIFRINEHRADLPFTLLNDTKLVDWRAILPACEKWVSERLDEINKKRSEYR